MTGDAPKGDPPTTGAPTGKRTPEWRDRKVLVTLVVFPIVVAVLGAWITGAGGWLIDQLRPDAEPVITGTQPPRIAEADPEAQERAREAGIEMLFSSICPWMVWTVVEPADTFAGPPPADGWPEDYTSHRTAGDANYSRLLLKVSPPPDQSVTVDAVQLKILRRDPAPAPDAAVVVALTDEGGCGTTSDTIYAHAVLDVGDEIAVTPDRGTGLRFPHRIAGGEQLLIDLVVGTATCDCTWVPVVHWTRQDGEQSTTEFRRDGVDFRTIPAAGHRQLAWKIDYSRTLPDGRHPWTPVPFQPELLKLNPDDRKID